VREGLGAESNPAQMGDVTAELASHLEDCYETLRAQGVSETEAVARALDEFGDLKQLVRGIRRAKRPLARINDRTKQLWVPGLASLTAANLLLMALTYTSLQPRFVAERSAACFPGLALITAYLPWVSSQPLFGALGAWLSHRAGGSRAMRLCSGLFPAIVMLSCWGLLIPASAAAERNGWAMQHPIFLVLGTLVWVAPATMGLLLGSLPFLGCWNFPGLDLRSQLAART
jgi:hypothetical protein